VSRAGESDSLVNPRPIGETVWVLPSSEAFKLNQSCFGLTLDRASLCAALEQKAGNPEFCRKHVMPRSHLFSNVPVFLPDLTGIF
jgi:hypothetical protein